MSGMVELTMNSLDEWSEYLDTDSSRIDEIGGYLMLSLSRDGVETAGDIMGYLEMMADRTGRESLLVDQSQQLHYRIEKHLEPMGLVTELERKNDPDDGGHPRRRYELTDYGLGWVETQDWDAQTAVEAVHLQDDYIMSLEDEIKSELDRLDDRLDSAEESAEKLTGTVGGLKSSVSAIDDRYDGLEEGHNRLRESLTETGSQLYDLQEKSAEIEEQIDEIEETTDQLASNDHSFSESLSSLSDRVDRLSEQADSIEDDIGAALEASAQPTIETSSNSRAITRLRYAVAGEGLAIVVVGLRVAGII
jgi:archaellum component FlaC